MTSYIDGTLVNDETIVYRAHISIWSLLGLMLVGLLLLPMFGIGLVFWLAAFIRYKTTELAVTSKRVVAKSGFISRQTVELNIQKVETVQVRQDVLGRIFNYGSLVVSGAGIPQAPIPGISAPMEFRRSFMTYQDTLRSLPAAAG